MKTKSWLSQLLSIPEPERGFSPHPTPLPIRWGEGETRAVAAASPLRLGVYPAVCSVVLALAMVTLARAQGFDSGSDGSFGAINITTVTAVNLPPDGIIRCTTFTIAPNISLTFNRNALNTPVYILAQGDIVISGQLDIHGSPGSSTSGSKPGLPGLGGPGAFDGGFAEFGGKPASDGQGPGAGRIGGTAGYATLGQGPADKRGSVYGNALIMPLVGGSGGPGSGGQAGGGGGGSILLASNTRIVVNVFQNTHGIYAKGGNGASGGAIRLVAPEVRLAGGGLDANGSAGGGGGRVRIDCFNRDALAGVGFIGGELTVGSTMVVFPPVVPRLDVVEAAGTVIPLDSEPATINLPVGSDPNRTVKIRAKDFNAKVPIRVVLTPDSGPSIDLDGEIDNQAANPAEITLNVTLPVNTRTTLHAWTR